MATHGEVRRRADGKWQWRFFIGDDERAIGTNLHDDRDKAIEDFREVIAYTVPSGVATCSAGACECSHSVNKRNRGGYVVCGECNEVIFE